MQLIQRHASARLCRTNLITSIQSTFLDGDSQRYGANSKQADRLLSLSSQCLQKESLISILRNDVTAYTNVSKDMIHKKYSDAYSFYEQFSHMDEVREAHDKVIAIQVYILIG